MRKLNSHSSTPHAAVVDGVSGDAEIANLMSSKLGTLLNTHSPALRDSLWSSLKSSLSVSQILDVSVTEDDVTAIHLGDGYWLRMRGWRGTLRLRIMHCLCFLPHIERAPIQRSSRQRCQSVKTFPTCEADDRDTAAWSS